MRSLQVFSISAGSMFLSRSLMYFTPTTVLITYSAGISSVTLCSISSTFFMLNNLFKLKSTRFYYWKRTIFTWQALSTSAQLFYRQSQKGSSSFSQWQNKIVKWCRPLALFRECYTQLPFLQYVPKFVPLWLLVSHVFSPVYGLVFLVWPKLVSYIIFHAKMTHFNLWHFSTN